MIKKKKSSGGGGANWMDTYGDMVTLLLCFFVLLYSMSTVTEEAWKKLVMTFNPYYAETDVSENTPGGGGYNGDVPEGTGITQDKVDGAMDYLFETIKTMVAQQGNEGNITVTRGEGKVFICFNQAVFFSGDSADLLDEAFPILDGISEILSTVKDAIYEVQILGHTAQANQNRPNNADVDRMLSSERATNVLIYVQEHSNMDPARLVSMGMGQWRPIASNNTPEGRAQNRRVEMIISGRNLEEELAGTIARYDV